MNNSKKQVNIILGITSGIAAFKMLGLTKILLKKGYSVQVIMTKHASYMINLIELKKIIGHKVFIELFGKDFDYRKILQKHEVDHIHLAQTANIIVVSPATANIIGKFTNGIADDFLTTTLLATQAPILICPSMNTNMWYHPAVVENVRRLKKRGVYFMEPASGSLACGTEGVGRLPPIDNIVRKIEIILHSKKSLRGKKILITAGATIESIDAVRYITNRGSGKMGVALAEVALSKGAEVLLLKSETAVDTYLPLRKETFTSSTHLGKLLKKYVPSYDLVFHTASVSDFTSSNISRKKLDGNRKITLDLFPTEKLIQSIKKLNPRCVLIGFKAVFQEKKTTLLQKGNKLLRDSHADYIVINDVAIKGIGFAAEENEVYILSSSKDIRKISRTSKHVIAEKIFEELEKRSI